MKIIYADAAKADLEAISIWIVDREELAHA